MARRPRARTSPHADTSSFVSDVTPRATRWCLARFPTAWRSPPPKAAARPPCQWGPPDRWRSTAPLWPTSLQRSSSLMRSQPAMDRSTRFGHWRASAASAPPVSSRQPVSRSFSRPPQPRATAMMPASCTCAQPNMSRRSRRPQKRPRASSARSPNSPRRGQPDTSTCSRSRQPDAKTARPSSVMWSHSDTVSDTRWGKPAAMADSAGSSRDAQRLSSRRCTRGQPSVIARRPTRVIWPQPDATSVRSSLQWRLTAQSAASVTRWQSVTSSDVIAGCMTQISCTVAFVTSRIASRA
mmetsp:Transcript_34123/g.115740  ORF Transcript_34123/g.115740 Transcript_34123/m.115740 type:complete len:296 (+) Transcript_34123:2173-3060(+)